MAPHNNSCLGATTLISSHRLVTSCFILAYGFIFRRKSRTLNKKAGKLVQAGFLSLRMGAFCTNFSITTPVFLMFL